MRVRKWDTSGLSLGILQNRGVMARPRKADLQRAAKDLNDLQIRFCQWLSHPEAHRKPATQQQLAVELGVNEVTLWRWSKDPHIVNAVRWMVLQNAGDPRRIGQVLDFIFDVWQQDEYPISRRLEAARDWLKAVGVNDAYKTQNRLLELKRVDEIDFDQLTDDELADIYEEYKKQMPGSGAGGVSGALEAGSGPQDTPNRSEAILDGSGDVFEDDSSVGIDDE